MNKNLFENYLKKKVNNSDRIADKENEIEIVDLVNDKANSANDVNLKQINDLDPAFPNTFTINSKPIQPIIKFPKNNNGRAFVAGWYTEYQWLEYSISKNGAFCFYCRNFAKSNDFKEFNCWSRPDKLLKHAQSESHLNALEDFNHRSKATPCLALIDSKYVLALAEVES